eukprot:4560406-Prymnesium_polylepis.1
MLQDATGSVEWISADLDPAVTWVHLPEELVASLVHASTHTVTVRAESHAAFSSESSATFTVDQTKPAVGAIQGRWANSFAYDFNQTNLSVVCVSSDAPLLEMRWEGMRDPEVDTEFAIRRQVGFATSSGCPGSGEFGSGLARATS